MSNTARYFKDAEFKRCVPSCSIDDMQQHIRKLQFLQRGFESLHQLVRQLTDEADGIRKKDGFTRRQGKLSRSRIEGSKKLVFRKYACICKRIEKR